MTHLWGIQGYVNIQFHAVKLNNGIFSLFMNSGIFLRIIKEKQVKYYSCRIFRDYSQVGCGGDTRYQGVSFTLNLNDDFKEWSFFKLTAFLRNFFLRQDRLSGDVPPHLSQSC